jgi:hypothetical protein
MTIDKCEANWSEIVEQEIARRKAPPPRLPSARHIIDAACWMRGDEPATVINWRKSTVVNGLLTRQWCVYSLRQLTRLSFPEIAALFGMKGHSTVYDAWKRFVRDVDKKTRDDGLDIIRKRAEYMAEVDK